jgi:hypothetical protein
MVMVLLVGCGGGKSDNSNNNSLNLKIEVSYVNDQSKKSILFIDTQKDISIQSDSQEAYFSNTLIGSGRHVFVLSATDQNGNQVIVDGSKVIWSCLAGGGTFSSNFGGSVAFNVDQPGKYIVSAEYEGETVITSVYFYNSNLLAIGSTFSQEKLGIIFSSQTMSDNIDGVDLYIQDKNTKPTTCPSGITFCAPNGIAVVDGNRSIRNLNINISQLDFKPEIFYDEFNHNDFNKVFIVRCKDGNFAKFRSNASQPTRRYSICYKYITDGVFSDI